MQRFDRYLFKNILIATVFVTIVLTAIVFLTQSLRFLELVIESGASSLSFWVLTMLALPRFFEVIVPLATIAAVIFVYNRMCMDSEMVAIRSAGYSPFQIGRSAIVLSLLLTIFLYAMTMFAAPNALSQMNKMRKIIKSQYSNVLFREGVFNRIGDDFTVYIKDKNSEGEMAGLMIHDSRKNNKYPSTILAQKGIIISNDDTMQVVVYDGSRQEYNPEKQILQNLNFERYVIDMPDSGPVATRWREPDERTIIELFNPNENNARDMESLRDFKVEIHKRFTNPLLVIGFTLIGIVAMLIGPVDRRGQGKRIIIAILCTLFIQGGYITAYNMARNSDIGYIFMYALTLLPIAITAFLMSGTSENMRRSLLYQNREKAL
ncbi:MAG: LPS export ABC transporter permease LptF [Alphaproteobacteria bacterium]